MQNPIEIDDGILDNILEDTTDENNDDLFNSVVKSTVESGECFGDFTQICEGTKFIPYYAVVESESVKMLHLSKKHVSNLVKKLETIKKFEGLIQFITSVIPSFSKMSSIARSRIGGCFKEKHYLPGTVLIKEGQPCDRMFLVMKGDVLLKSSKSPIQVAEQSSGTEKIYLQILDPRKDIFQIPSTPTKLASNLKSNGSVKKVLSSTKECIFTVQLPKTKSLHCTKAR